jgi:hypothetical protein
MSYQNINIASPRSGIYASYQDIYNQMTQNNVFEFIPGSSSVAIPKVGSEPKITLTGFGTCSLRGAMTITGTTTAKNSVLGKLPKGLFAIQNFFFPVSCYDVINNDFYQNTLLISGVDVSVTGATILSATIVNAGSFVTIPTITVQGNGTGAVVSIDAMQLKTATLQNSGTGYAVNDVWRDLDGGQIRVNSIGAGGSIATYSILAPGVYMNLPSNPVPQTSTTGSGTGATFNMTWELAAVRVSPNMGYDPAKTTIVANGGVQLNPVFSNPSINSIVLCNASKNVGDIIYIDTPPILLKPY